MRLPVRWFAACRSSALRERPIGATVLGVPLVLFRGADGRPAALEDRCPQRNAPLSAGRVEDGVLACAYHGWRFDAGGACLAVPGLEGPPGTRAARAPAFACLEQNGLVWTSPTPGAGPPPPFRFPHLGALGYDVLGPQIGRLLAEAERGEIPAGGAG